MSNDKIGAWEILGCLMNGGTLYLRGSDWTATLKEVSLHIEKPSITDELIGLQVDTLISTPSILSKYRRQTFPGIKYVVTGGEPCPKA